MDMFIQYNMNSYCAINKNLTYEDKIDAFVGHLKKRYVNLNNISAILITEYLAGKGGKYITLLEEELDYDFDIIVPLKYDYLNHPRALLTVIAINRSIKYDVLNYISPLPNRINYIRLRPDNQKPLRLLGCYMVQTSKFYPGISEEYKKDRFELKEQVWDHVLAEAGDEDLEEDLVVFGDLNEGSDGENLKILTDEMGYVEYCGMHQAIENADVDHFFLKAKHHSIYSSEVDIFPIGVYSDHPIITTIVL